MVVCTLLLRIVSRKPVRSIDRIARTARKVLISRDFVRAVLLRGIDRQWTVTERHRKYRSRIDCLGIWRFAGLSSSTQSPRSVRAVLFRFNHAACFSHPSSEAFRLLSSSENMLERVVPSALANRSAATIEGVLSALSTAPT